MEMSGIIIAGCAMACPVRLVRGELREWIMQSWNCEVVPPVLTVVHLGAAHHKLA